MLFQSHAAVDADDNPTIPQYWTRIIPRSGLPDVHVSGAYVPERTGSGLRQEDHSRRTQFVDEKGG
jgi:hypothetical protein